jgi:hypothetical protein
LFLKCHRTLVPHSPSAAGCSEAEALFVSFCLHKAS